jgi:hypothetical protein
VGLLWFLQNDPAVPATLRDEARAWGWAERFDAPENRGRGFAGDALVNDGFEQRFVGSLRFFDFEREDSGFCDEFREAFIGARKVFVRFNVVEGRR